MASRGKIGLYCFLLIITLFSCVHLTLSLKDKLHISDQNVHNFKMFKQSDNSPLVERIKRSVLKEHNDLIRKRSTPEVDVKCQQQKQTFLADLKNNEDFMHMSKFENETKFTMSLVWAGKNDGVIIVVVTEEQFIFALPSTVYRSADHGKTWKTIDEKIGHATIRKDNGLQKHTHIPSFIVLVAHTQSAHSALYISSDGGANFRKQTLDFMLDTNIVFHPNMTYQKLMLTLSAQAETLHISRDSGETWKQINSFVKSFKWSTYVKDPPGTIYAVIDPHHSTWMSQMFGGDNADYTLVKSTDYGAKKKKVPTATLR